MGMLTWENGQYLLDGQPYRIISGAIHYFRVVPEYWEDRLLKLKACGFNTVETYIAWNVHEPQEGNLTLAVWQTSHRLSNWPGNWACTSSSDPARSSVRNGNLVGCRAGCLVMEKYGFAAATRSI